MEIRWNSRGIPLCVIALYRAEEICRCVWAVMPDISRTTVYNTLREMVTVDALVEVEDLSGGGMRYDTNPAKILDARWG